MSGQLTNDEEELVELMSNWLAIRMAQSQRPMCALKTLLETMADEAVEIYETEDKNFLPSN